MLAKKHKDLQLAVDKTIESLQDLEGLSQDVLDLVVSDVLTKFHHKLGVGVEDSVSDLLDDFKQKVVDQIINEANRWKIPKSDVVIFPRNCRFFYEKGDSTIVVIEEEPKNRNVRLKGELVGELGSRIYMIPVPYVVYIFHCKQNRLANAYIGWRSTPLMRTSDKLARPLLPNCHANLEICWGRGSMPAGDSIAELCENAITQYWSAEFNGDLKERWHNRSSIDSALDPIGSWSRQDTMFMIGLNYHHSDDSSIEDKIRQITGHIDEPNMDAIRHRLYDLTNKHSEILFSKIIRYFKRVKPDRFYPKQVTDELKSSLELCARDFLDVFHVLLFEYNKLESRIKESEGKRIVPKGPFWDEEMKNGKRTR